MALVRACALAEIAADEALAVTVDDVAVAIARDGDEVYAVRNECSHQAVELSEGEVADCEIECYLHGSRFSLKTGEPTGPPATQPVATFATAVRDGEVYVDITQSLNGVRYA